MVFFGHGLTPDKRRESPVRPARGLAYPFDLAAAGAPKGGAPLSFSRQNRVSSETVKVRPGAP